MDKLKYYSNNLRYDFPASIVVFLVAVPLCLGIALASGAPAISGIIAGIIGGIIVGAFSGSQLGVSGPAAGLAVVVLSSIEELGGFQYLLVAVALAGVIQIILGYLKAGIVGYYFPTSVIKGMLSGIGIIIFLKQIPHAFGYDADPEGDLKFFQMDGHNTFSELYYMMDFISLGAVLVTTVSLAILIIWEQPKVKKHKILGILQGPLIVVVLGILINIFTKDSSLLSISTENLVNIPIFSNFGDFSEKMILPDFTAFQNPDVFKVAFIIAIVASLETLLCVEATDKLDPQKRITPTSKELVAQGIGNTISGLIGGLPITQVIVRSSANIQSGGKTKLSAIIHGFLIAICVIAIPDILNMIPLASLAAILLLVGYKLAKPSLFKEMMNKGVYQFVPYVATILGIVFTDLLVGIGIGLVVAIFNILYENYKTPYFFQIEESDEGHKVTIKLAEDVTFINKAAILKRLSKIPENSTVTIDASQSVHIDMDVIEIITDFKNTGHLKNIKTKLIGFDKKEAIKKKSKDLLGELKEA